MIKRLFCLISMLIVTQYIHSSDLPAPLEATLPYIDSLRSLHGSPILVIPGTAVFPNSELSDAASPVAFHSTPQAGTKTGSLSSSPNTTLRVAQDDQDIESRAPRTTYVVVPSRGNDNGIDLLVLDEKAVKVAALTAVAGVNQQNIELKSDVAAATSSSTNPKKVLPEQTERTFCNCC